MSRWRYLRWWLAALAACVLSYLSPWLSMFIPGDASVFCGGPLSASPSEMQSGFERTWERLRDPLTSTTEHLLVLYTLPSVSALLSAAVAAWAGRRLSTAVGALAVSAMLVVAFEWVFLGLRYLRMLNCAGWDGRLPWLLLHLVPVLGYGSAAVLLIGGIRVRWRMERGREFGQERPVGRS